MKELTRIQQTLKANKSKYNAFGKFRYRSLEDILEAVKPLLGDNKLYLNDDIVTVADRVYVKATATLVTSDGETLSVCAYARESEHKTGMDDAQVTGAASSYARKYALNAMFLIDDTAEPDTYEGEPQDAKTKTKAKTVALSDEVVRAIADEARACKDNKSLTEVYRYHAGKGEWNEKLTEIFRRIKTDKGWN